MISSHPHYHVVAAIIQHGDDFLCMQRGKTRFSYTSFKYEFPGGKVEVGETAEEALHREIREEMEYEIDITRKIATVRHKYPDFEITMDAYLCHVTSRQFKMKEHNAFIWLPLSDLKTLDWAAADVSILHQLQKELKKTQGLKGSNA